MSLLILMASVCQVLPPSEVENPFVEEPLYRETVLPKVSSAALRWMVMLFQPKGTSQSPICLKSEVRGRKRNVL